LPQNPQRQVHALLGGFVQDMPINNQNRCHKTDKIIARTSLFSKNQKIYDLPKRLLKNIDPICAKFPAKKSKLYFDQNDY
jgi:hypothetical protein